MGRPRASLPTYRLHKPSGRAVCYVNRKPVYLGKHGSPESKQAFAALLDRLAQGLPTDQVPSKRDQQPTLTMADLCLAFVTKEFPRLSESERGAFRSAIRVCRQLYGETPAADFGPLRYRAMRDAMVNGAKGSTLPPEPDGTPAKDRQPWCRATANRQAKRIRQIVRWGVSWEMVQPDVLAKLDSVRSLAVGETPAADPAPRLAVPTADIEAVRAVLKPRHRDLVDLLLLTGARPGELLKLTGAMIERRRPEAWIAELTDHKTSRKGKRRFLLFNVASQAILLRYFKPDPTAKLFPMRRDNLCHVIRRACRRANVTPWVPHQLRHTVSTRLVDEVGLEGAQHVLGHSEAAMTQHYSRAAERAAVDAVQRLG